ncbi:GYDIA family GHMP kinase [Flavobacterium sp. JP2137]|uniref:GYDIA family GHMP kinase n=1 Tax=Flavobacterium sp. JP2137 TaxID=3414510 RepID=UPI003D2FF0A9
MTSPSCYYSHGKLLITAEYLVLDGAQALALPTKMGQQLRVTPVKTGEIHWLSFDRDGAVWIDETFAVSRILNLQLQSTDSPYLKTLLQILAAAHRLNPQFFEQSRGFDVETQLEFPRIWGLGTSSTVINNIAQWVGVDAFQLLQDAFGGSGYDIACAQYHSPILYTRTHAGPQIESVVFNPVFSDCLYFVYLNQKQDSKAGIARYREYSANRSSQKAEINALTQQLLHSNSLEEFECLLEQHEAIIAAIIDMPKVKEVFFPDFTGAVKSLGAWGGDFVLVTAKKNPLAYFSAKGFDVVLPYREMIL